MVVKKRRESFQSMFIWLGENRINPKVAKKVTFLLPDSISGKPDSLSPEFFLVWGPECLQNTDWGSSLTWRYSEWSEYVLLFRGMSLCFVIKLQWLSNKGEVHEDKQGLPSSPNAGRQQVRQVFTKATPVRRGGSVPHKHLFYAVCLAWEENTRKAGQM